MPYAVPLTVCLLALAAFHCGLTNGQIRLPLNPCETSRRNPCPPNTSCVPANTSLGYQCICSPGFTGSGCEPEAAEVPEDIQQLEAKQLETSRQRVPIFPGIDVNLMTTDGPPPILQNGMSWHSALTQGSGNCICDRQGVLKLTIDPGMVAEIKMTFSESFRYTFNVGDSVSNNAWGGDSNHQKNDAEVHSYGKGIYFYGRDFPPPFWGSFGLLHSDGNFVALQPFTTLTLRVADQLVTADNGLGTIIINTLTTFALNGQADQGGVNQHVYLGMNRVVGTHWRWGRGLCRVSVRIDLL